MKDITFKDFCLNIHELVEKGVISSKELNLSEEITDYTLAVMYATALIGQAKGYPCDVTPEDIWHSIMSFAPELANEEAEN